MLPVTPAAHLQDRVFAAGVVNRSESGASNKLGSFADHTFTHSHTSRRDIEIHRFRELRERRTKLANAGGGVIAPRAAVCSALP
jgi:hypothetical protein